MNFWIVVNTTPPEATCNFARKSVRLSACTGSCRSRSRHRAKVVNSWSSRSLRSVITTIVGFSIAGCRISRPAQKAMARLLPEPWGVPDDADPLVSGLAAGAVAGEIGSGRFFGFQRDIGGAQRLFDRDVDRVELVISRYHLNQHATAEILENNEMANKIKISARFEYPGEHDLQLGEARHRILALADRTPRLEPFLPDSERAD